MDKTDVLKQLDDVAAKLAIATQKLFDLKGRSRYMTAEEIMRELLIILNFGDELEQKPSIII